MGTGSQPESNRASSQDMVPESTNEEQEEFSATGGASGSEQQQQLQREQPQPPREPPPPVAPRGPAPRAARQAPPVTRAFLWDVPPPRYSQLKRKVSSVVLDGSHLRFVVQTCSSSRYTVTYLDASRWVRRVPENVTNTVSSVCVYVVLITNIFSVIFTRLNMSR